MPKWNHGRLSPFPRGGIKPGASIPARRANGMFSCVGTRDLPHHDKSCDDTEGKLRCHEPDPVNVAPKHGIENAHNGVQQPRPQNRSNQAA